MTACADTTLAKRQRPGKRCAQDRTCDQEKRHAPAESPAAQPRRRRPACHEAQAADPVKIRASWVAPVSNWASILLEKKDLARHLGKSYVLEPVRYQGTPPMITALANGELEIANLAYSTLGIAIQNAGLDDIRVIADDSATACRAATRTNISCSPTGRSRSRRT